MYNPLVTVVSICPESQYIYRDHEGGNDFFEDSFVRVRIRSPWRLPNSYPEVRLFTVQAVHYIFPKPLFIFSNPHYVKNLPQWVVPHEFLVNQKPPLSLVNSYILWEPSHA